MERADMERADIERADMERADMERKDESYERAKKRVEDVKGFYVHLGIYVIVNIALFSINMLTNPDTLWFYWPLLGWGIGVAIHAFALFVDESRSTRRWEERKLREYLEQERKSEPVG